MAGYATPIVVWSWAQIADVHFWDPQMNAPPVGLNSHRVRSILKHSPDGQGHQVLLSVGQRVKKFGTA